MALDSAEIWLHVDRQRADLAELLGGLTTEQWSTPSLCAGWTVRDVAAHLTHLHAPMADMLAAAVRSGFRFDAMMNRLVLSDTRTPEQISAALRSMVGSRRRPPMASPLDPLMDVLVHGQDIAVPLGVDRPMPVPAAVAVAEHLWRMRFPMNPRRMLHGVRLVADDAEFSVGAGTQVHAPIKEVLLMLSGRRAVSLDADPA